MTATETKTRTITMTGRPPVRIRDDEWPVLAEASDDSYGGRDVSRYRQAKGQGEIDTYVLKVRQHANGRTLVYGILDAAIAAWHAPAGGQSRRGGELLTPPGDGPLTADDGRTVAMADIVSAIQRVGRDCHLPESVIRACVADLPAEQI